MNTAGLGGVGGPYRLDGGSDVFQVADWEKAQVPEEVRCNCFNLISSHTAGSDILFDKFYFTSSQ